MVKTSSPFFHRLLTLIVVLLSWPQFAGAAPHSAHVSQDIARKLQGGDNTDTRVIVTGTRDRIEAVAARHGLKVRKWLKTGAALDIPAGFLQRVVEDDDVDQMSGNLPVIAHMAVTRVTIGADQVQQDGWAPGLKGLTGKGVGVAVIDSGVANLPELKGRIAASVDFTDDKGKGLDENGHGTHIAGIIAAGAHTPRDQAFGVAPEANIISLKVLDAEGRGLSSDVIDAIDWAIANRAKFHIQVINLSLGAPVLQSWRDDPLDQAVERAYRAGITVVAAAGNFGKDRTTGKPLIGGITAPGNSPFAITVGAVDTHGTPWRSDDEIAAFSSRGPTAIDHLIKPDLTAPGVHIRSLLAPGTWIAKQHPELVVGSGKDATLELSGTSMAAAVVSGAAAVLESLRDLSPMGTHLLLQWTSEHSVNASLLGAGSGQLNLLAAALAGAGQPEPAVRIASEPIMSGHVVFMAGPTAIEADRIIRGNADTIVWSTADTIVWSTADTIVWSTADTIVWSTADTIVWSTADTIVWSTTDTIVWSTTDTIVWSTTDTIVWSTSFGDLES